MRTYIKRIIISAAPYTIMLAWPAALSAATEPAAVSTPWAWILARAAGITGYILLFALTISGISIKTGLTYKFIDPVKAWLIHKYLGIATAAAIVVHLTALLVDPFLKFGLYEIFVPFATNYQSLYVAFGIVGFYLFAATLLSSLFFFMKPYFLWRMLHYLPYPIFALIFLHGVITGTDSSVPLMIWVYWTTGGLVALFSLYRIYLSFKLRA